jgi:hypothetical protein
VAAEFVAPDSRRTGLAIVWTLAVVVVAAPLALNLRGHLWGDFEVNLSMRVTRVLATVLAVLFAAALSRRLGGRVLLPVALVVLYGAALILTDWPTLVAGGAAGLAALSAALALMLTTPAPTFARAVVETLLAAVVATIGGLGVAGVDAGLRQGRFGALVLVVTVLGAFVMVYRLGAGFHGLGRRGYAVAGGAAGLLLISLFYGWAFSRWGSSDLVDGMDSLRDHIRHYIYAVPHPIEAILGVPALCWGSFMRARRRQGWWVCAFGAAVTAPSATRFVVSGVSLESALISIGYTLLIGFVLAWLVIRVDQRLTGSRGRRARRVEEADALRPEPPRFAALL